MWRGIPALQGKKVVDIFNDSALLPLCYTVIYRVGLGLGLVSSSDPPDHAPLGKLEREKWEEGLVLPRVAPLEC